MAHLYRVGAALLFALTLAMVWTPVRAANGWKYTAGSVCKATVAEVGQQWVAGHNVSDGTFTYYFTVSSVNETTGAYGGTYYSVNNSNGASSAGSPAAWTAQALTCTYVSQDDANCKAIADGLTFIGAPLVHYGAVGLTACYAGYVVEGSGGAAGGGQSELYGPFKCSGSSPSLCSAVPKPSSIVVTCNPGEYPGTVNGVQVCVPPSSTVEAPKTTTATPPSAGASAPQIPNAPAGTVSQSEQVTCTGTTCTKVISYKDASGNSKGSVAEDIPKANYCADNPKAPGCEAEKSSFGGNCSGGFTYKGDAIQGALAQEVYRQNCLNNAATTESALYDTEKVKTGDQTTGLPGNSSVTVSPSDFDSTDAIGGAACITDRTVVVWGKTVVLPFSTVCPVMGHLKTILLAVSYLSAAGIVLNRRS